MDSPLKTFLGLLVLALSLGACTSVRAEEKRERQLYMERFERETLDWLVADRPEAVQALEQAAGYAIVHKTATQGPIAGAGAAYGMWYDRGRDERVCYRLTRFDLSFGWKVPDFRLVFLFSDQETTTQYRRSGYTAGFGGKPVALADDDGKPVPGAVVRGGYLMFTLTEPGKEPEAAPVRLIRFETIAL